MKLKNIIFLVFIVFALNAFYQPVQINSLKLRHTIVRQINFEEDKLTDEILVNNEKYLFRELISITAAAALAEGTSLFFNTS